MPRSLNWCEDPRTEFTILEHTLVQHKPKNWALPEHRTYVLSRQDLLRQLRHSICGEDPSTVLPAAWIHYESSFASCSTQPLPSGSLKVAYRPQGATWISVADDKPRFRSIS